MQIPYCAGKNLQITLYAYVFQTHYTQRNMLFGIHRPCQAFHSKNVFPIEVEDQAN